MLCELWKVQGAGFQASGTPSEQHCRAEVQTGKTPQPIESYGCLHHTHPSSPTPSKLHSSNHSTLFCCLTILRSACLSSHTVHLLCLPCGLPRYPRNPETKPCSAPSHIPTPLSADSPPHLTTFLPKGPRRCSRRCLTVAATATPTHICLTVTTAVPSLTFATFRPALLRNRTVLTPSLDSGPI